jgi:very-short-patch-repair endonuclease
MSPIEQRLWHALRVSQLGSSFRRQHPVGPFVLDFYAPSLGLAIELDGDEHAMSVRRDAARTRILAGKGIRVIRFSNREVWNNLESVLQAITQEISIGR